MILVLADGSNGHYYLDAEGRVHTARYYQIDPAGMIGPRPGERPLGGYTQFAGATPFWLPTGQVEWLTSYHRVWLADARHDRDAEYEKAELALEAA